MKKQTRQPLSFMEALEAELRKEIQAEFEESNQAKSEFTSESKLKSQSGCSAYERLELWLNARVSPRVGETSRPAAFSGYRTQAKLKSEHVGSSEPVSARARVSEAVAEAVAAAHEFVSTAANEFVSAQTEPKSVSHNLDVMDIAALEFFRRNGVSLKESFDESDLKSAYRKLALKFHPDRHTGADEVTRARCNEMFTQATEQTKRLSRHLNSTSASAA